MPYKDKEKQKQASIECHKKAYYPAIAIRIRRDNAEFYDALSKAAADQNITPTEYARNAVKRTLIDDGYLLDRQD